MSLHKMVEELTIANEVYDDNKGTELSNTLKVVGTDGTASMTGKQSWIH